MSNHSIIEHRANYHFIKLEEDYLLICENGEQYAHCKAMILTVLEHWINDKRIKGQDEYVYMTYPQWIEAMYGLFRRNHIISCLTELEQDNMILKRPIRIHGKNSYEYTLNVQVIQEKLKALPERVEKYTRPNINAFKFKRVQKQTDVNLNEETDTNLNGSEHEDASKFGHNIDSITENLTNIDSDSFGVCDNSQNANDDTLTHVDITFPIGIGTKKETTHPDTSTSEPTQGEDHEPLAPTIPVVAFSDFSPRNGSRADTSPTATLVAQGVSRDTDAVGQGEINDSNQLHPLGDICGVSSGSLRTTQDIRQDEVVSAIQLATRNHLEDDDPEKTVPRISVVSLNGARHDHTPAATHPTPVPSTDRADSLPIPGIDSSGMVSRQDTLQAGHVSSLQVQQEQKAAQIQVTQHTNSVPSAGSLFSSHPPQQATNAPVASVPPDREQRGAGGDKPEKPKRTRPTREKPNLPPPEDELNEDEMALYREWCSMFHVAVPLNKAIVQAAKQLATPCMTWATLLDKPRVGILKDIKDYVYRNDRNGYYKQRGVKLYDCSREFEGWQTYQEKLLEEERRRKERESQSHRNGYQKPPEAPPQQLLPVLAPVRAAGVRR